MNEVEKMYENAGVERTKGDCTLCPLDIQTCVRSYDKCPYYYPPFTAEKQLELIKWLAKRLDFGLEYYQNKTWAVQTQFSWEFFCKTYEHEEFEQALAGLINTLWQDLTEEEKQQVKGILE